jgi:hypothetical protein
MTDISIVGRDLSLIEPGEYLVRYGYHETNKSAFGGKPKVYLNFIIVSKCYFGLEIFGAYNVKEITGNGSRNGGFKLTRRQELTRQIMSVAPQLRLDRITMAHLKDQIIRVSVRTVDTDYKKRPLPISMQYSVVDEMLAIVERSNTFDPVPITIDQRPMTNIP